MEKMVLCKLVNNKENESSYSEENLRKKSKEKILCQQNLADASFKD